MTTFSCLLVILLIFISAVSSYIYFCPPPAIEYFILFQFELFKLHRTLTYFALNFYSVIYLLSFLSIRTADMQILVFIGRNLIPVIQVVKIYRWRGKVMNTI